jgi:hypothetical protein
VIVSLFRFFMSFRHPLRAARLAALCLIVLVAALPARADTPSASPAPAAPPNSVSYQIPLDGKTAGLPIGTGGASSPASGGNKGTANGTVSEPCTSRQLGTIRYNQTQQTVEVCTY